MESITIKVGTRIKMGNAGIYTVTEICDEDGDACAVEAMGYHVYAPVSEFLDKHFDGTITILSGDESA